MDQLLQRLDVSELLTRFVAMLPNLFAAIVVLIGFWALSRVTRTPLKVALRSAQLDEALVRLLADNVYGGVLWLIAVITAASQIGINVTAALAGLGVAGIAVGFAAQDSIANMISGFLIFWDKPFRVGDVVTVNEQYGKVVEITMRTTRIRTLNNTYVVIPNKTIIDSVLENHSKHGEVRLNVPIGIAYKESIPDARRVLLDAMRHLPDVMTEPAPDVVVKETASSSVDLMIRVWIADAEVERPVYFRVLEAAKLALDAAGIEIPYPHLQLFVENVEDRVVDKIAALPAMTSGRQARQLPPGSDGGST